ANSYRYLGLCLIRANDYAHAISSLELSLKLYTNQGETTWHSHDAQSLLGYAQVALGKEKERGRQLLQKSHEALNLQPEKIPIYKRERILKQAQERLDSMDKLPT
ncbi:MAG: hypothetical protein AAF497_29000, partial [Planctomycetota bacterium]